ncbi:MAG: hypothetical protein Q9184_000251 [Pyrenodesmia sp. 2 TL-2023]
MATGLPVQSKVADDEPPAFDPGQTQALPATKTLSGIFSGNIGHVHVYPPPTTHCQPLMVPAPPPPLPTFEFNIPGFQSVWTPCLPVSTQPLDDHLVLDDLSSDNRLWLSMDNVWCRSGTLQPGYYGLDLLYHTMSCFLQLAQSTPLSLPHGRLAMLPLMPLMIEEKQKIRSILTRCIAENHIPQERVYMDMKNPGDSWRLTREIFLLLQNLGRSIWFDAKEAILIDFRVHTHEVQFHLDMDGQPSTFPTKTFADIISECRGYRFEGPREHETLDEKTYEKSELEQESSEEKTSDTETIKLEEQFEEVNMAAGEAETEGHNEP